MKEKEILVKEKCASYGEEFLVRARHFAQFAQARLEEHHHLVTGGGKQSMYTTADRRKNTVY